jgi:hypothetical protein
MPEKGKGQKTKNHQESPVLRINKNAITDTTTKEFQPCNVSICTQIKKYYCPPNKKTIAHLGLQANACL